MLPALLRRTPQKGALGEGLNVVDFHELQNLVERRRGAAAAGDAALDGQLSTRIVGLLERAAQTRAADEKLQSNERIKYTATFLNAMAAAIVSAGVATPTIGLFVPGSPYASNPTLLVELGGGCFLFATVLHIFVRRMLRLLRA